jgi:DNA-binding SARP family transcriptional activator
VPLHIRLLGEPRLERDGEPVAGPRGNKAWALLAYLLLGRRRPSRRALAELLFSEADDPLGALRWSLAQLRQALGQHDALRGDPLEIALAPDTMVDVRALRATAPHDVDDLVSLSGQLLQGMAFATSVAFDAWLTVERRHMAAVVEGLLLERAQAELGNERTTTAARLATRLVELNPLEEVHHELIVRCLVAGGDRVAALSRVEACEQLWVRELGTPPSPRLRALVPVADPARVERALGTPAAVRGELEAGRAAIAAGAVDAGLETLRHACAAAERCGDTYLHARAQLALGSALLHTMRAYGEGAPALHAAIEIARRIGDDAIAATAYRELGFVDVQAGRHDQAESWLAAAAAAAAGRDEELASIACVRAMGLTDAARYEEAIESLEESLECGRRSDHRRQVAHSLAHLGRAYVLTARHGDARTALETSLERCEEQNWIAFTPLPEALLAHVELAEQRSEAARELLDHAFTLACKLGDPCWEAVVCRGLGLVDRAAGRSAQAIGWMLDGRARILRIAHPYQWIHGWVLDGLCRVGCDDDRADTWIAQLDALASRTGMRELLLRAYLHRAGRGDPGARDAATLLGAEIDNPSVWTEAG